MSDWTIKGQAAKSLDDSVVDLELTNYTGVKITRTNQGTDTLSFFVACDDATTDPDYLPEYQQEISIFRAGTRQFVGYVGKPKFALQGGVFGWSIEAQNGWQELDRVALTTTNAEYVRAQGSLSGTITDVINKAIAVGARISLGSVAAMFDIPAISFRGTSCGAALIELLRICADSVAYFDYSGAGNPALTVVRRGSMATKTITFGTDEIIEPFSCSPIPGATPTKVTVAYATRDANGIVTETIQSSGSGSEIQSVVLTNTNFSDFLTKAASAQVTLRTAATPPAWADFQDMSPVIRQIIADHGSFSLSPANSTNTRVWSGSISSKTLVTTAFTTPYFTCPTSLTGWYPIALGDHREWMQKALGISAKKGWLQGDWVMWRTYTGVPPTAPDWWLALIAEGAVLKRQGFYANSTSGDATDQEMYFYSPRLECTFIDRAVAANTIFRDPGDYGPTAPPANLAADLLSAQAFTPYEGQFNLSPWHSPELLLNKKINFGGLTSRLASIGALVQSETLDVQTGKIQATLGLAARQGAASLARLRRLSSSI